MGLVLYPDNYTGSALSGTVEALPEGIVFLPAAGYRLGSNVSYVGDTGNYWSSTAYESDGSSVLSFDSSIFYPNSYGFLVYGYSVRLVTEVK